MYLYIYIILKIIIIPVYNLQACVYPLLLSARTKAFIPHFVGFLGIYWIKCSLPLKPIMDSSTAISRPSLYADLKLSSKGSMNGLSLYSGSYPGWPLGMYCVLSFRWRKRRISEKRSRLKMLEKVVVAKGHFVDHASSIWGSTTNPMVMMTARNFFSSQRCVVFSPTLEPLRSEAALWHRCTAEQRDWSGRLLPAADHRG